MAEKMSERTKVMIEGFMADHNNGLTIPEIAEKYHLNKVTVYRNLETIAQREGVLREDLLKVVKIHTSDAMWQKRHAEAKKSLASLQEEICQTTRQTENLLEILGMLTDEENEK